MAAAAAEPAAMAEVVPMHLFLRQNAVVQELVRLVRDRRSDCAGLEQQLRAVDQEATHAAVEVLSTAARRKLQRIFKTKYFQNEIQIIFTENQSGAMSPSSFHFYLLIFTFQYLIQKTN